MVSFERLAPCSQILVSFESLAPCSSLSSGLFVLSFSSGLLLRLKIFGLFRAVCSLLLNSLSLLLLVLKISSLLRAVCSLFSNSLVSLKRFKQFAPCVSLFREVCSSGSSSLVSFERFGPRSQIPQSLSSGLLLVLKYSSPFRLVSTLFSNSPL